jgi:Zn-dependent protease
MAEPLDVRRCAACGSELAPKVLACPVCRHLVHADEVKQCIARSQAASAASNPSETLAALRRAQELLPPGSRQHQAVTTQIQQLSSTVEQTTPSRRLGKPASAASGKTGAWAAIVTTIALAIWKLKFIIGFALTKGKLLLLGLTKAGTFFSMILSLGAYWAAWGWRFALGLVLSIYVHEMGHVAALRRYGVKAGAPMFIPGFGAMVRLHQYPATPREDARVGLAGPLWGLAACLATYGVYLVTQWPSWAAIAKVGAWINLLNLAPIWQLDGSRGFRTLTRSQQWIAALIIGLAWVASAEGLLVIMLMIAIFRAAATTPSDQPDRTVLLQYATLVIALTALSRIRAADLPM